MSMQSIREALTKHGNLSAAQIGARIDLGPSSVSDQLKKLRERKEIHICDWVLFAGFGPGRNCPIYALGNAPDAENKIRGRKAKIKAARAAKPVPVKSSPYAQAKQQAGMWGGLMA